MSTAPFDIQSAMAVQAQQKTVASGIHALREVLDNIPDVPADLDPFHEWIEQTLTTLISTVESITITYAQRITPLESAARTQNTSPLTQATHAQSTASSTPAPTTSCLQQCGKCHARGHKASQCQTANPSAMRRQVAANSTQAHVNRSSHNTF